MRRIGVTGSGGFIGRNLIPALKQDHYDVLEISRRNGIDISNWNSLVNLPKCDAIIHLAAKTFVPDSFKDPAEFYRFNIQATIHALELARKWNAKMVYMSSYLYGPPLYIPVDEAHPLSPHNPYAESKLISEQLCKAYCRDFGVKALAFRLFNLYGPGQTGSFLIPEILEKIKTGRLVLKDPRPKRDYIHVFDVIRALTKAIEWQWENFEILNLATGDSVSVETIVNHFLELTNNGFEVEYTNEYRKGEVLESVGDPKKLKEVLGLGDLIRIREGLKTLL